MAQSRSRLGAAGRRYVEGLKVMKVLTINRLGLATPADPVPGKDELLIDSTHLGRKTEDPQDVTQLEERSDGLASGLQSLVRPTTAKNPRRIIGYDQLYKVRAHLDDHDRGCRNRVRQPRRCDDSPEPSCLTDMVGYTASHAGGSWRRRRTLCARCGIARPSTSSVATPQMSLRSSSFPRVRSSSFTGEAEEHLQCVWARRAVQAADAAVGRPA